MPHPESDPIDGNQHIEAAAVLLVEGGAPEALLSALVQDMGLSDAVTLLDFQGFHQLTKFIKVLVVSPDFFRVRSIGIVRDAETNAERAFHSVRDSVSGAGLVAPDRLAEPSTGQPRVGVFLFPNCQDPGMLEDLLLTAIRETPAMPCVDEYFKCLEDANACEARNRSKARLQVFLASKPISVLGSKPAILKQYLPIDQPVFEPLRSFIRSLIPQDLSSLDPEPSSIE